MQGAVFHSSSFGRMVSLSLYSMMGIHFPGSIERKLKASSRSVRQPSSDSHKSYIYGPSIHSFQEMPRCPPKANVMLEEGLCHSHLGELRICSVRGAALVTGSSVQRQIWSHWAWEAAMILSLWGCWWVPSPSPGALARGVVAALPA